MQYLVSITRTFSSAHALRGYRGKCERLHGHNWKVKAAVSGTELDKTGMLIDFTELKAVLDGIILKLDHRDLNTVKPFNKINPTAENIAAYVYLELKAKLKSRNARVKEVVVWESDTSSVKVSE